MTDYQLDTAEAIESGADYSVERTDSGGHVLDVYPPVGPAYSRRYWPDGSRRS